MEYFLEKIAKELYNEFGERLNSHCLVFPGRRAGLFFLKYLATGLMKPVWVPGIMTINDLFHSFSRLKSTENELLLIKLYKAYCAIKQSSETFDDFYFWGDMLLSDFDDVDKYLADPEKLFRNVADIKKIDQEFGGLTPEQIEIVKRFWVNFNPEKSTDQKKGFLNTWKVLFDLYTSFRESLRAAGIGYEGMIFRDVIEKELWKTGAGSDWEMFHFIGFNALNECEKSLMLTLKNKGIARFYWDFDNSYMTESNLNSAGYFLRNNIRIFGNNMPDDWNYDTLISGVGNNVKRRIIATSSDIAQVKLISHCISELPGISSENAHETAVVLADENLLVPVLSSLPDQIKDINVTMGFPLKQTSVYSLINSLLELQRNARISNSHTLFGYKDIMAVLKNPLIIHILDSSDDEIVNKLTEGGEQWIQSERFSGSERLSSIFFKAPSPGEISEYLRWILSLIAESEGASDLESNDLLSRKNIRNEFIYRVFLSINRLDTVTSDPAIKITTDTWIRILDRLMRMQSVPFSGEPLTGLQIMGILETRTLDFKNLILLSVNEGVLPSAGPASSFIPYNLREAFGLPSLNHRESVFAYHFYRLLHRAENIVFIYNSNPDGLKTGEMSRFLQQMKYEPQLEKEFLNLSFEIGNHGTISTTVERTEEMGKELLKRSLRKGNIPYLSATAVNLWLNCRMRFYYRYVNGIEEPEENKAEIDPAMFGILLHDIMKNLYSGFTGKEVSNEIIDSIRTDKKSLTKLINDSITENFRSDTYSYPAGNELIVRDVLLVYIERILNIDNLFAPFTIIAVEKPFSFRIPADEEGKFPEIIAGGRIDRIDNKGGVTRIVDYKTGTVSDTIGSVSDLFTGDRDKGPDGWLQSLLYCEGYMAENPEIKLIPSIYKIKKVPGNEFSDRLIIKPARSEDIVVNDYNYVRQEFLEGLRAIVKTIFSPDEPFIMTEKRWNKCGFCPYRVLCRR